MPKVRPGKLPPERKGGTLNSERLKGDKARMHRLGDYLRWIASGAEGLRKSKLGWLPIKWIT